MAMSSMLHAEVPELRGEGIVSERFPVLCSQPISSPRLESLDLCW